jgi:hypothetical protein
LRQMSFKVGKKRHGNVNKSSSSLAMPTLQEIECMSYVDSVKFLTFMKQQQFQIENGSKHQIGITKDKRPGMPHIRIDKTLESNDGYEIRFEINLILSI